MVKTQFGLTTLIIFIAMIVTAAIAAGVIIYTTQTLQQRALQVGAQARERVATGVEVTRVFGYQYDLQTKSLNPNLQAVSVIAPVIRLMAGSKPIGFERISFILTTQYGDVLSYKIGSSLPTTVYGVMQGGNYIIYGFLYNGNVNVLNVTLDDPKICNIINEYSGKYIIANKMVVNETVVSCSIALNQSAISVPLTTTNMLNLLSEMYDAGIDSPIAVIGIFASQLSPYLQEGDIYEVVLYLGRYLTPNTRYTLQIIPQDGYIFTVDGKIPTVLTQVFEDIWAAG